MGGTMDEKIRVVSASGIPKLDEELSLSEGIELVAACNLKSEIMAKIEDYQPEILIVSDHISGDENVVKLLMDVHKAYPGVRVIYFAGTVTQRDTKRLHNLGTLVMLGINDIFLGNVINNDIVLDAIYNPKAPEAVSFLASSLVDTDTEVHNASGGLVYEEALGDDEDDVQSNLFVFTSIKPGTGKSFTSINTACAVAKYGRNHPRVALIDADLQTLSVGTAMGMADDPKRNLKVALETIGTIIQQGHVIDDLEKVKRANRVIRECFIRYNKIPNLDILIGSGLTPEEVDAMHVEAAYYEYLIDVIKDIYDVIIVDMNSSIFHVTTALMLSRCKYAYYIMNLDFNNIRNNVRYRAMLDSMEMSKKIKYVLNQAIENTEQYDFLGVDERPIVFTPDDMEKKSSLKIFKKIPYMPPVIAINDQYNGLPVILDNDERLDHVHLALMEIAEDIYPLDGTIDRLRKSLEIKPGLNLNDLFGFRKRRRPSLKNGYGAATVQPRVDTAHNVFVDGDADVDPAADTDCADHAGV